MGNKVTLEEEITFLTGIWYDYVSQDHHKDRDCHWYIEMVWSYGNPPNYRVRHPGYIMDNWASISCGTMELAQTLLRDKLLNEIRSAKMDLKDRIDEFLKEEEQDLIYDVNIFKEQLKVLERVS